MTDTAPDTAMPAEIASLVERLRINAESWRRDDALEARDESEADLADEAATALEALSARNERLRKALDALDRMSRGVDWCDQDEQARRWSAARRALTEAGRRALGKGERDAG